MRGGRVFATTRLLGAFVALCLGLLATASALAAQSAPEHLTPGERAWLAAHPRIVLGAADDWVATVNSDARGNHSGFIVDYLDLLNRKLGTDIRVEVGPWQEIVKKAEAGEIDGLTLTAPLAERRRHFLFTEVVYTSPEFLYLRTGDPLGKKVPFALDDLQGKRVGYITGSLRSFQALANYPAITAVPIGSNAELAQQLLSGNLDAVLAPFTLEYWLTKNAIVGMAATRIIPEVESRIVMSINKASPELVGILDKGIGAVTKSEWAEMYRKWYGTGTVNLIAADQVRLTADERAWLAGHDVIRIGFDPRRAPVEFLDESGAAVGISATYLERVAKTLGVRFEVTSNLSSAEALRALEARRLDALAAVVATPGRSQKMLFTAPYLSLPSAIFSATEVAYIAGPEGLKGKTVAVVRGEAEEEWLRGNSPDVQLLPVTDIGDALKAVAGGRAYAFIGNQVITSYYIGQMGLPQIRVVGETPFVYQIAMGVRSDWPMLAGILQKGIDAIPATEREAIYREGISIRYQSRFDYTLLWMVAGGAVLILLLVFAERTLRLNRANSRLQRLARELSQVEERERRRLAGELHDSPMQKLALAQLQFSAASGEVDSGPAARLGNGLDLMREALDELHTLQFELSPPLLYREGLASALEWLAAHATERFDVAFSFQDGAPTVRVPQELAIVLFQVARELVYNVAKHAAARTGSIALDVNGNDVVLSVTDDGKGFAESSGGHRRRGGFGLFSVRERVMLFDGEVSIAATDAGSRVSVRMPLPPQVEPVTGSAEQTPGSPRASPDEVAP